MTNDPKRPQQAAGLSRREFIGQVAAVACGMTLFGHSSHSRARPTAPPFDSRLVPQKNPAVRIEMRQQSELLVIYGSQPEKSCQLNHTAKQVWAAIDGRRSARQIARQVCAAYREHSADCVDAVLHFIRQLHAQQLITFNHP